MKIGNIVCCFCVIILLEIFDKSHCETPLSTCPLTKPFRVKDGCANFTDICIKNDDSECKRFLTACEQCPPSNMTNILLLYIQAELKSQKSDSQLQFLQLDNKVDLTRRKLHNNTELITILLIIIIIINIFLVIVLLIEIRFKLITKCLHMKSKRSREKEYQMVNQNNQVMEMGPSVVNEISNVFGQILDKAMEKLRESLDNPFTKFKVDGIEKMIELQIKVDDCVVKIKQLICEKIPTDRKPNYKIMKLKFMDRFLDNNKYLLSQISIGQATIFCHIDNNIDPSDDVILQLCGNRKLPEFIQVNKNLLISELKTIISEFISSNDFVILKGRNTFVKLDENLTVEKNELHDQDFIKIITNEIRNFKIRSIFDENDIINVTCHITNSVSKLCELSAQRFNTDPMNFILFLHNQYLSSERFIYEFEQDWENEMKFCCLRNMNLIIPTNSITFGDSSEIYKVHDPNLNAQVILKRYKLLKENLLKVGSPIINELITCQITKQNSTFVKLLGVYKNESHLFISLEYLENGSIKEFILRNGLQSEKKIARWSTKILEGLKFLKDHCIIHRDLKPSNILLDKNNTIKLSGFDLSKYTANGFVTSRVGTYRYMAPEIHQGEMYGCEVDVWSFGVTLIEIATGKKIYPEKNELDFVPKLLESNDIYWDRIPENSETLVQFINMCLIFDPQTRATVEELLNHIFLKME